jgi:hypothetical protein
MRLSLFLVCMLLATLTSVAQNNNMDKPTKGGNTPTSTPPITTTNDTTIVDVIVLKSGVVFKGTIISQIQNVGYSIRLMDGTVLDFEARLVEQVLKERSVNGRIVSDAGSDVMYKAPDKYANIKQYFLVGGANLNISLPFFSDVSNGDVSASIGYSYGFHGFGGYRLGNAIYIGALLGYNIGKGQYASSNISQVVSFDERMFSYGLGPIWKSNIIGDLSYQYVFIGQDFSTISYEGIVFNPNTGRTEKATIDDRKHSLTIGTGILVEIYNGLSFMTETRFNYFRGSGNLNARLGLVYSPNLINK